MGYRKMILVDSFLSMRPPITEQGQLFTSVPVMETRHRRIQSEAPRLRQSRLDTKMIAMMTVVWTSRPTNPFTAHDTASNQD